MSWLAVLTAVCLAALLAGLVATPLDRRFDTDEFQHLQMGWLIHAGAVPYLDFFEHHTPVFHFALRPVFAALDVAASAGDAVASVRVARALARGLALLLVAGTFGLGARLGGPLAGLAAALSLASLSFFVQKGLEIRPDHFGALGLVAAVLALLAAVRGPAAERSAAARLALFAAAGAATSFALLSTQKTLLAWPGLGLALLLAARAGPDDGRVRRSVSAVAAALAGAGIVAAPVVIWFAARGALDEFVRLNFLLNAAWPAQMPVARIAATFASENPLVIALGVGGVAIALARPGRRTQAWIVLAPLASLVLGLAVIPIALAQYYYLALPFLAVFAGLALAAAAARGRLGARVAALLILAVAAFGAYRVVSELRAPRATGVLAKLEYVVDRTSPSSTVLSAWSPGLVYRRPAFHYWSLHREIRQVISPAEYESLREGLASGRIAPELVEMDKHMLRMPAAIVCQLEAGYEPVGLGTLWRRRSAADPVNGGPAGALPRCPTEPGTPAGDGR